MQLLSTEAFIDNTIDTSWLDGIIAAKGLTAGAISDTPQLIVGSAALFKAHSQFKEANSLVSDTLSKGQQPAQADLKAARLAEVEVTYEGVKYAFAATKVAADQIRMSFKDTVGVKTFTSRMREQSDGTVRVATRSRTDPLTPPHTPSFRIRCVRPCTSVPACHHTSSVESGGSWTDTP